MFSAGLRGRRVAGDARVVYEPVLEEALHHEGAVALAYEGERLLERQREDGGVVEEGEPCGGGRDGAPGSSKINASKGRQLRTYRLGGKIMVQATVRQLEKWRG